MRVLKSELCPSCGKITNERYRQMKALNRRRWEQIQALETEVDQLKDIVARLNRGLTITSENNYRYRQENEQLLTQLAEAEEFVQAHCDGYARELWSRKKESPPDGSSTIS